MAKGLVYGRRVALPPAESERTCKKCGETKPLTMEFFYRNGVSKATGCWHFRGTCIVCTDAYRQAKWEKMSDKERRRDREVRAMKQRARRLNPEARERDRQQSKRYRERKKQEDPQAYFEGERIRRVLQRDAAGKPAGNVRRVFTEGHVPRLPVEPLLEVVLARIAHLERTAFYDLRDANDFTLSQRAIVAEQIGIDVRSLRRWEADRGRINFDVADRALIALDLLWWDVWDESNTSPDDLAKVRMAFEGEEAA